ncbi:glycosyltransferase family 39 protein [Micromonospora sp. NBRC 101691]|uniref:glycosyltransferase family 39 protein n=1 Tax=Micromonospora sp. NBRC 101691 TaxID=3032198 RepID=UPI0024A5CD22|nr:glycosyltransferase family 39 protein [Micromonospora sp. NBRC 101691]GLY24344.1 glycosyl transferase [Micromonospora sp. NBRC 101691]
MERTETLPTPSVVGSGPAADAPAGSGPAADAPVGSGPVTGALAGHRPPPRPTRDRPRWTRAAVVALLLGTALLYLWGLGASGWANAYYSAAAQAGSASWTAFFYGSSDAANSITVDKTPASLWLMALSVRLFGLSSWSILVPQALLGVATVGVLYATVRRWHGPAAGLIAGTVLALTPVATLMFRFNNPDALLVLLLTVAAYATVRALETASTRWITLVGVLVGFGFLTKMLQAFLVVPVFAGVYLVAAPTGFRRRIRQLLLAGLGLVAAAGWWVAVVELVPAESRPYIGGSQTDSVLELTLGYNGLGRLTGDEVGSVGPRGGGPFSAQTGLLRMFDTEVGGQISWLLPAALILLVAGLVLAGGAARTDRTRAGLLLWGGWLLVTGAVFSLMGGIFHAYYTVALAPAVGALVGTGVTLLWRHRAGAPVPTAVPTATATATATASRWRGWCATGALAVAVAVTAWWSWTLLGRSPDWFPWLRTVVPVAGLAGTLLVLVAGRLTRRLTPLVLAVGAVTALAGPAAYAAQTAATPHAGSIPSAGPAVQGGFGGGPGRMRAGLPPGGGEFPGLPGRRSGQDGQEDGRSGPAGTPFPGFPDGGPAPQGSQVPDGGQTPGGAAPGGPTGGNVLRGGGLGGLLNATEPSAELRALLEADSDDYTWVAATVGSNNASGYQLATGAPVMAIGGFNGSDPSPTLAQFQRYVADGEIHWFLGGGGFRANGGSNASAEIAAWVAGNFASQTVDGTTVYDLSSGRQG